MVRYLALLLSISVLKQDLGTSLYRNAINGESTRRAYTDNEVRKKVDVCMFFEARVHRSRVEMLSRVSYSTKQCMRKIKVAVV